MIRAPILVLALLAGVSPLLAQSSSVERQYVAEQAELQTLRTAPGATSLRALGDLLANGTIAAPDNPLRRSDRGGAIAAYQAAMAAGDRSDGLVVRLAKLLLGRVDDGISTDDRAPLAALEPALRRAMFAGNGDAAYVLALAAELNVIGQAEEREKLLQTAIVIGNVAAILESARDAGIGQTVRASALEKLQQRAAAGSSDAMVALARLHADGALVAEDQALAMQWFEKAAATGDPQAAVEFAARLLHGPQTDPARARAFLVAAAEDGSRQAALQIGIDAATGGPMGITTEEGRLWLTRAVAIEARGAAPHLVALDMRIALTQPGDDAQRQNRIEAALQPIAQDPDALTALANRQWSSRDAALIEPVLLPLLHDATIAGNMNAGLAYDAWLRAAGKPLPAEAARVLVSNLRRSIAGNVGFATFALADLSLDGRLPEDTVSPAEAIDFLFRAADASVGQAMLRLAQMYAYGDGFAQSDLFATRWYRAAAEHRVETATWELAALQARDTHAEKRGQAEAFYKARLADGDPRAGPALVRLQLKQKRLDPRSLARAETVALLPEDRFELAKALIVDGGERSLAEANRILTPYLDKTGDPVALVLEARLLLDPGNKAGDPERGVRLLEKAAGAGALEAKLALASLYLTRMRYRDRQAEAVALLEAVLAARPASIPARLLLSDAYLRGHGVARNSSRASELVSQVLAENGGNPQAGMLEAEWLIYSEDRRDPQRASALLETQARRGSIASTRALGLSYVNGFGTGIDQDRAVTHLSKAAAAGDKEAMAAMGHVLLNGVGTSAEPDQGVAWLEQAADQGNIAAMYDLSRIYALGALGTVDNARSAVWLRRAAEQDHPSAAYQLGLLYLEGDGVPKDRAEAIRWFTRSSEVGNLLAARTVKALSQSPDADLSELDADAE